MIALPRPGQAALVIGAAAYGLAAHSANADAYLCHFVQSCDDDGLAPHCTLASLGREYQIGALVDLGPAAEGARSYAGLYEGKHPFLLTLSADGQARLTEHRNMSRRDGTATSFRGACQEVER
ncbi:hypothetical protein [Salipiger mangrovisoli]|uniref:Uncharacterized protein n=1 Tax=Salipiger mangrovisoli TaxID=2865933 RepID=A0ABR9X9X0_9RHOB|nr:hypothetical protein [Salipiger mangrovisoli]MBE9640250.1 hypothetical protein [Salipiger mangrovisoli]